MKFVVNNEIKEIMLMVWDGRRFSPDFLFELELDFDDHEYDEDDNRIITEEEYREIIEYWQNQIKAANNGLWSEQFGNWRMHRKEYEELVLVFDD